MLQKGTNFQKSTELNLFLHQPTNQDFFPINDIYKTNRNFQFVKGNKSLKKVMKMQMMLKKTKKNAACGVYMNSM